ncbi:hypothetical protein Tcan_00782, partial [Toxocara canis]
MVRMLSANAKELRQTTSISFIFPPIIDRFQAHTHPCPWAKGQTDRSQSPRLVVWKRNIVDAKCSWLTGSNLSAIGCQATQFLTSLRSHIRAVRIQRAAALAHDASRHNRYAHEWSAFCQHSVLR